MKCPKCGCPFINQTGTRTADGYSAWQDTDGTWYNGPAQESTTRSCAAGCGWSEQVEKRRGKVVSREERHHFAD